MDTIFNEMGEANITGIIDFCLVILLIIGVNCLVFYFLKRWKVRIITMLTCVVGLVSYIFKLYGFCILIIALLLLFLIFAFFINMSELRNYMSNQNLSSKNFTSKNDEITKIYNKDALYRTIDDTVLYLSKHKIGAIMTFEKNDNLEKTIKNGTKINAPVTFELLITIFYPGTRLHDGAVVIKGNKIIAASVYYTPTTKPLVGKYGSRHRAAIGISEECDAVTVVVSEETGKISIAYNGEIDSYSTETFIKAFINLMTENGSIGSADVVGENHGKNF